MEPSAFETKEWTQEVDKWVPDYDDFVTPEGITWFGNASFVIFGPTAEEYIYFSPNLRLGNNDQDLESRKAGRRKASRNNAAQHERENRNASGEERGMGLA